MDPNYTIDFAKDWRLYHFSQNEFQHLPKTSFEKGTAEKNHIDLLSNGGFLIIPSALSNKPQMEAALEKSSSREELVADIVNENEIPDILALLNFREDIKDKIESIEVETVPEIKSGDDPDIYSEEAFTITFKDDFDLASQNLDVELKVFEGARTIEGADPSTKGGADQNLQIDIITEFFVYDKDGNEQYSEYLIPEDIHALSDLSVSFPLNNHGLFFRQTKGGNQIKGLFKKIRVLVKKIVGGVRRLVAATKNKGVDFVIELLRYSFSKKSKARYKVLRYDNASKEFVPLNNPIEEIDVDLKTVILLHGTVKGSFDARFGKKKKNRGSFKYLYKDEFLGYAHWIDYLFNQQGLSTQYEQILTFEHETLLDGPKENVERFIKILQLNKIQFSQPVALLSASRGSLLAKYLPVSDLSKNIPIDRIAIASGGYSDYFDSKKGIKNWINLILKLVGLNNPLKMVLTLSLDIITKLPGLEVQNQGSDRFKRLIEKKNDIYFFNLVNNYSAQDGFQKVFEKAIADNILGPENDLALSIPSQKDNRPGLIHPRYEPFDGTSKHGDGLKEEAPKLALFQFLTDDLSIGV